MNPVSDTRAAAPSTGPAVSSSAQASNTQATMTQARQERLIEFILEIGAALHLHGEPAHSLEQALTGMAERFGLQSAFFATPTSLMAGFGEASDQTTRMIRIEATRTDLGKLRRLREVADAVSDRVVSIEEGIVRTREIVQDPGRYSGAWVTILVAGVEGATVAPLLGGGWAESAVAAVLGMLVGVLLSSSVGRSQRTLPLLTFIATFIVTFLASWFERTLESVVLLTVVVSSVVILLPGLTFTTAMLELSTRNLASGTARLAGAGISLLQLASGVAFGTVLATAIWGPSPVVPDVTAVPLPLLAFGVLGFAAVLVVDFRAEPDDTPWIMLVGLLSWAVAWVARPLGPEPSVFAAALAVGLASELYASVSRRPISVVLVPGIIFLVPGSIGFRSVTLLSLQDVDAGVGAAFAMMMVAVALAAGVLTSSSVFFAARELWGRYGLDERSHS